MQLAASAACCLQNSAQVLLTLDNLANRSQYINARNTFEELLGYGEARLLRITHLEW